MSTAVEGVEDTKCGIQLDVRYCTHYKRYERVSRDSTSFLRPEWRIIPICNVEPHLKMPISTIEALNRQFKPVFSTC